MAGVGSAGPSSAAQFRAIAWVRWRMFVNGFRRKGSKGELAARIVLLPFVAMIAIGPIVGAGFGGWYAVHAHAAWVFSLLMWAVFGAWVFVMAATTLQPSTIDLSLLLRFPVRFSSYLATRFFFGLMAMPNVIGTLALAAAAIGMGIAEPRIFPWAALVLAVYALMMILLLRMVLLWTDRWLAQRRTREIFGVVFTLFFLSFQYFNVQMQNFGHNRHGRRGIDVLAARFAWATTFYHAFRPVVEALPPSLAARAILRMQDGVPLAATGALMGVLAFLGVFGALFAWRLQGEFRGENFNEAPARVVVTKAGGEHGTRGLRIGGLPPAIAACVEKELRYLVRGPSMLLAVLTPLVLVGLYANRMGSFELLLPAALAYTMFSMVPMLYNVLGRDAAGAQLYLLSPTPMRTVFLAKNLVLSALICCVAGVAGVLVTYKHPPVAAIGVGTAFWFAFVLFVNLSFGNYRSVSSPVKVDMGKIQRRQGTSQMSGLIVIGVLFGSLLAGFVLLWGCRALGYVWAAPALLLLMAIAAFAFYLRTLSRIEQKVLDNRDALIEVLGKGTV